VSPNYLCAGAHGADSCVADSGGPLIVNIDGDLVQIGIVAGEVGNFGCGGTDTYGLYTKVHMVYDWIAAKSGLTDLAYIRKSPSCTCSGESATRQVTDLYSASALSVTIGARCDFWDKKYPPSANSDVAILPEAWCFVAADTGCTTHQLDYVSHKLLSTEPCLAHSAAPNAPVLSAKPSGPVSGPIAITTPRPVFRPTTGVPATAVPAEASAAIPVRIPSAEMLLLFLMPFFLWPQ